ncbi:hypothetical protein D320_09192 [Haloferax sp. BAB-2207]|nr:TIGR00341 family protein [Haloferax sp. BAB-2207]ELK54601.1 hypothetical protein D320_09192 [Haloferax sp. BAB-2207]
MRLVQVLIPRGSRESVLESLDGQGVDYAVFEEVGRGDFEAMVQFPVPPSGVETVMEKLTNAGVRDDSYTIVLPTETVVSQRLSALKERFPGLRISREELHARAEDLAPANSTFFSFLILSTVIAATGLLLDSVATIIGAMVVAPLMGPAVSASVGAILADQRMATRGVVLQVTGLAAAIATAAVLGVVLQQTILIPPGVDIQAIPQVAERTSPNVLSLFLALGSGIAGAISIMRGSGSTLVGVAIAVALVLAGVTYASFQTASFEQQTQAELQRQFDEADIEGVELVSVTVDYRSIDYLLGNQPRVDVLVGIPRDLQAPPDLAQRFDDQLTAELGRDVVVRVGFVEAQVSDEDTELLINGDAFGLWEFTDVDGLDKFDALVDRYPELFGQFEATGERVPITLIPGNHDYERVAKDAPNEETWFQRLVTPAPGRGDDIPSRTVVRPTTESSGSAATNPSGGDATTEAPRRPVRREVYRTGRGIEDDGL